MKTTEQEARVALKRLYETASDRNASATTDADYIRVCFALDEKRQPQSHTESELYGMISTLTRERDEARSKPTDVVMLGRLRTIARRLRELAGTPGDGSQYAEFYLDAVEAQMTMLRRNFKELQSTTRIPSTSRKREIEDALGIDPYGPKALNWWQDIIFRIQRLRVELDEAKADYSRLASEYATRQNPSVEDLQRSLAECNRRRDEVMDQRDAAIAECRLVVAQRDEAQKDAKSKGEYVNVLSQTVAGIDEMLTAVHGASSEDLFTRIAQLSNQAVVDRQTLQQIAEVTGAKYAANEAAKALEIAEEHIAELKAQIECLESIPDRGIVP